MDDLIIKLRRAKRTRHLDKALLRELGKALGPILKKPHGDLSREFAKLRAYLKTCPHPERVIYSPMPHHVQRKRARIWWLQILLMIAQGYPSRRWVFHSRRVVPNLGTFKKAQAAAQKKWKQHFKDAGRTAAIDQIIESLEFLKDVLPRICKVDGQHLVWKGRRIGRKLGNQERAFLELLIKAQGRSVTQTKFAAKGIKHPKELKSRLVKKVGLKFLDPRIRGGPADGYYLDLD